MKKQLNREQHEKEHLRVMNSKCAEELELTVSVQVANLDHHDNVMICLASKVGLLSGRAEAKRNDSCHRKQQAT